MYWKLCVSGALSRNTENSVGLPSSCWQFVAEEPGPSLLILGGVHGDEKSGIQAVSQLLEHLRSGAIVLKRGTLSLALGNERAIEAQRRALDGYNLNRMFGYGDIRSEVYEERRAAELEAFIEKHDVVLDLHSTSSESDPFLVLHQHSGEIENALEIDTHLVIDDSYPMLQGVCTSFASKSGKLGITLESGQHDCEKAARVAVEVVERMLVRLGFVSRGPLASHIALEASPARESLFTLYAQAKTSPYFQFQRAFRNFEALKPGEPIAWDEKFLYRLSFHVSSELKIALPTRPEKQSVGEEVFFLTGSNPSEKNLIKRELRLH